MKVAASILGILMCVSCFRITHDNLATNTHTRSDNNHFIGEWKRGQLSEGGVYSERLVITQKSVELYEDGNLVLTGSPVADQDDLIISTNMNNSRYYRKLGGCWARLRNNNMSLDLFGKVKGLLSFDRKTTEQ